MSTENQVHLRGQFERDEIRAAAAITPGHLIEKVAAGTCQKHSTEGGVAMRMFAEIDALQGNTLDDDYAAAALVAVNLEHIGNDCQAFLKAGENVTIGEKLISAGDGTLIAAGSVSSGTTVADNVATAQEAKDLSGSGAVDTLIKVRILPS
ncbi:MAG: hypothetical protein ACTSO3_01075 [Candidatus Heimdallarchaeaceae archaeon]